MLDFFVVCRKLKEFVQRMVIDEQKEYHLSRYMKDGKKDSDHNTLIMYMNLNFFEKKQERIEMFNFKNSEDQEKFFKLTETKSELRKCFQNQNEIDKQSTEWFKALNSYFQQSFTKKRSCKTKKKLTELDKLLKKRTELVQKLKKSNEDTKEEIKRAVEEIENKISELSAEENRNKIVENLSHLSDGNGTTSHSGLWAINKKLFPKNKESLPFAKNTLKETL